MPDPEEQVTSDQMPPSVRYSFADLRASLAPGLTLGNFRRLSNGWVAGVYDAHGENGGDYLVLDEPEESSVDH